jgi:translation initiation factor 5A
MLIKGKPCKVLSISTSKTGKHGHAKCNFTAQDIFTGKKCEEIIPSTHTAQVPNVSRKEYTMVDLSEDEFLTLMDDEGATREDIKLPAGDMAFDIKEKWQDQDKEWLVTVLSAMGHEQVVQIKAAA